MHKILSTRLRCIAHHPEDMQLARILLEHGANVSAQETTGSTPLHFASRGGYAELACILLEHGADVKAHDNLGSTPLHFASSEGHTELVRILLEHGANVKVQNIS